MKGRCSGHRPSTSASVNAFVPRCINDYDYSTSRFVTVTFNPELMSEPSHCTTEGNAA